MSLPDNPPSGFEEGRKAERQDIIKFLSKMRKVHLDFIEDPRFKNKIDVFTIRVQELSFLINCLKGFKP